MSIAETAPSARRREGNFELLRIVCMLLIMAHHMVYHSAAIQTAHPVNRVIARVLFAGGMTGVNCFVMITGYFLAPFRAKRLLSILLETLLYSVGITLILYLTGLNKDITWDTLKNAALVVSRSPYWFVVMYLGLTAVLPLLQPGVKALSRNAHRCVLAAGTVYLCLIPTFTFQDPSSQFFHQITWFFYLYVLGAYFKKFPSRGDAWLPVHGGLFLLMIAFIAASTLWGDGHTELFQRVGSRQNFFADKDLLGRAVPVFRGAAGTGDKNAAVPFLRQFRGLSDPRSQSAAGFPLAGLGPGMAVRPGGKLSPGGGAAAHGAVSGLRGDRLAAAAVSGRAAAPEAGADDGPDRPMDGIKEYLEKQG